MRSSYIALAFGPLVCAAACSVYDSSLLVDGPGGSGAGASANGGTGQGGTGQGGQAAGGANTCVHAVAPDPPADPPAGDRDSEIIVIMKTIDFGDEADPVGTRYRTLGFDLDNRCTTAENQKLAECRIPSYADGVPDGPQGQDNAIGASIQYVRALLQGDFSSDSYNKQLASGTSNVIMHVTKYNGLADDGQVRVETLVSGEFQKTNGGRSPNWDGNDHWPVASDSVQDGDVKKPLFFDDNAYVTKKKLVAGLPDLGLRLDVGLASAQSVNLKLPLKGAYVVCDIEESALGEWGFTLSHCNLGARWLADNLIKQLSHFPDPQSLGSDQSRPLCPGPGTSYAAFKKKVCSLIDVNNTGLAQPTETCDSLSMGLTFDMLPGYMADVFQVNDVGEACTKVKGYLLPSEDSCGTLEETGTGGQSSTGGKPGTGGAGGGTGGTSSTGGTASDGGPDGSTDSGTSDASQ